MVVVLLGQVFYYYVLAFQPAKKILGLNPRLSQAQGIKYINDMKKTGHSFLARKLIVVISFIVFLNKLPAQVPGYFPTNGLVGCYMFNSDATDLSSNNNNGTVNGAVLTNDRFNIPNSAYHFNGTSAHIAMRNAPFTNFPFSIIAWVRLPSLAGTNVVIGLGDYGTSPANTFCFDATYLSLGNLSVQTGTLGGFLSTTAIIPANAWTQIAVTASGYGKYSFTFYINGVAYTSNIPPNTPSNPNPFPLNNAGFDIGRYPEQNSYFKGDIDDIAIYDRVLTHNEVSQIYQGSLVGINENSTISAISLYAHEKTIYLSTNNYEHRTLNIFSIDGKLLYKEIALQKQSINFESGLYIATISDQQNNTLYSKKIVLD